MTGDILRSFLFMCTFAASYLSLQTRIVEADRPNFVLIVADDLGYGDLGCYGNDSNKTPHIDALAASGARFTDFHSAGPMCSPTRAAMLTGRYQQRFGEMFDRALSGVSQRDQGLPHQAVTIAELLKKQGYHSACFGKWHLGYQPPWLPTNQGFDLFRGLGSGDGDFHTHVDRSGNNDWWHNNKIEMVDGYTTDLLTQYSVDFIAAHHDEPFLLYVPHLAIHFPWQGPNDPPHRQAGTKYHHDKWGVIPDPNNVSPHVRAMIESLDDSVGAIIDALQHWNLVEKTLVVFTSDNGGYLTYGSNFKRISSNGALRGQKSELYEGGHRVPTIISWPGRIDSCVTSETAHSVDLLPTFANLTGVDAAEYQSDGVDLGPHLFEGSDLPSRKLFWRAGSQSAVRDGPWKLYRKGKQTALYNLDDDLSERTDLADANPNLVKQLIASWDRWQTDVNQSAATIESEE